MGNIGALAYSTFQETVRDRIFYLVGVFGIIMLASTAILSPLTIGAQNKIMIDVGLAGMAVIGLLVILFVGSGMVRKELDKGTILTILSKPVGRREYLAGKFLGLSLTLAMMLLAMAALFLLMLLLAPGAFSYVYLKAFYMTLLELILINAVVVFFSTAVSPILTAVFSLCAFVVGHMSESIRDFGMMRDNVFEQKFFESIYYLTPNLEVFNVRGAMVHGEPVTWTHLGLATLYGVGWSVLLLLLAGAVFQRKELRG